MADISADSLIPSRDFKPTSFSGALVQASGVTSFTIPAPPTGQRVRLLALAATSGTTETGISITADGFTVVNNLSLRSAASTAAGDFTINQQASGTTSGALQYIEARGAIVISKGSGSTANAINYSYAYGF